MVSSNLGIRVNTNLDVQNNDDDDDDVGPDSDDDECKENHDLDDKDITDNNDVNDVKVVVVDDVGVVVLMIVEMPMFVMRTTMIQFVESSGLAKGSHPSKNNGIL